MNKAGEKVSSPIFISFFIVLFGNAPRNKKSLARINLSAGPESGRAHPLFKQQYSVNHKIDP